MSMRKDFEKNFYGQAHTSCAIGFEKERWRLHAHFMKSTFTVVIINKQSFSGYQVVRGPTPTLWTKEKGEQSTKQLRVSRVSRVFLTRTFLKENGRCLEHEKISSSKLDVLFSVERGSVGARVSNPLLL